MDFLLIVITLAWLGTKLLPEGKPQGFAGLLVALFGFLYFINNNAPPFLYILLLIAAGFSIHSLVVKETEKKSAIQIDEEPIEPKYDPLAEEVRCLHCNANIKLNDVERKVRKFICTECGKANDRAAYSL